MNKDLKFIKDFSKITITSICKDVHVDRGNLLNGKASNSSTLKVKEELVHRLRQILKDID